MNNEIKTNKECKFDIWKNALENNTEVLEMHMHGPMAYTFGKVLNGKNYVGPTEYSEYIFVIPKKGLYTASLLQRFMKRLAPEGIMPDECYNFNQYKKDFCLDLGMLVIKENVGEEKIVKKCSLPYQSISDMLGINNNSVQSLETNPITLETVIIPYPSKALYDDLCETGLNISEILCIPPSILNMYKTGENKNMTKSWIYTKFNRFYIDKKND